MCAPYLIALFYLVLIMISFRFPLVSPHTHAYAHTNKHMSQQFKCFGFLVTHTNIHKHLHRHYVLTRHSWAKVLQKFGIPPSYKTILPYHLNQTRHIQSTVIYYTQISLPLPQTKETIQSIHIINTTVPLFKLFLLCCGKCQESSCRLFC